MRKSGAWMSIWDDRLLEWLSEDEHGQGAPKQMMTSDYFHVSKAQVVRRLQRLEEHGLVYSVEGWYEITERGKAYLAGEVDVSED
jgi:DNA-binding PadR family transcriptional regulator